MIKLVKTDNVRRKEFHVKESERIDSKKVSKKLRHMSKKQRHKQNPAKLALRSAKSVKMSRKEKNRQEFIDENNMEDALLAYHKFFETMRKRKDFLFKGYNKCFNLSHLSRQEWLKMKSDCDKLYPHLKAVNRFHCYLMSLQEQHIINEKLRSERFYRKRKMEHEEENVRKNLKYGTSESTQESTSFAPPLSPKRLKIQQKKSKLMNKYRERAQEVYDKFWKLKFENLDAKMARGVHEKDDFESIPTRFQMDPIANNFWLDKWQISTKYWDELPKDLIYSHRKYIRMLSSPVREKEKIHNITILKRSKSSSARKQFAFTSILNNGQTLAQEVTIEQNETAENNSQSPSRLGTLLNYLSGNTPNKLNESTAPTLNAPEQTATETEFQEVVPPPNQDDDGSDKNYENINTNDEEDNADTNPYNFDESTIYHTNNSDIQHAKFSKIKNILNSSNVDMSSLKEFVQYHEKTQNQELSKLQTHFLQP